jgi:hypothetical protein
LRRKLLTAIAALMLLVSACALVTKTLQTGGEQQLAKNPPPPAPPTGTHVLIFAMDGACPAQFEQAVRSGKAPHIATLLGEERGKGLYAHAYAARNALSVLPSSTIADWASIFTGAAPAYDGVPGDEWFDRITMQFYAPVPVSVPETDDNAKMETDDLVGRQLQVKTLYERLGVRSNVSMLSIYRGATLYTMVSPGSFTDLIAHLIKGTLAGEDAKKSLSAAIDHDAVDKLIDAIDQHGLPDLQVVYFPGIDIFTHAAKNPLASQLHYLEDVTDPEVGRVLEEYVRHGAMDHTYVIFISDHAHIPTDKDERHQLDTDDENSPYEAVAKAGFRVRRPTLSLAPDQDNYQAVLAYQGFMAYIYLANRSTCRHEHDRCRWSQPPRLEEDVMPVVKTIYRSNMTGHPVRKLKGTIDLIFTRPPVGRGEDALPYMIYDGRYLVPIGEYLAKHPRPDLVDLERRMNWLSAGPYGNRAGDILLLAKACTQLPINQRYYFAGITHYSWHGSACEQDSHIPFVLANPASSGDEMRAIIDDFGGDSISERAMTPMVEELFGKLSDPTVARARRGAHSTARTAER